MPQSFLTVDLRSSIAIHPHNYVRSHLVTFVITNHRHIRYVCTSRVVELPKQFIVALAFRGDSLNILVYILLGFV